LPILILIPGSQNIKEGIEGRPASWYNDVFDLVFPNLDKEAANECKICEWKKENDSKSNGDK
jgi:ATP-dependent Lon protease